MYQRHPDVMCALFITFRFMRFVPAYCHRFIAFLSDIILFSISLSIPSFPLLHTFERVCVRARLDWVRFILLLFSLAFEEEKCASHTFQAV